MLYSRRIQATGGGVIGAVARTAWSRLVHKQLLFLYPFVLGLLESLGFLAVYTVADGRLRWSDFAAANAQPWVWLQDNLRHILSSPTTVVVALVVGVVVCVLSAAIRAPFFRAVVGPGYPLAPRSVPELARLSLFYLVFNALLYLVPILFDPKSILFQGVLLLMLIVAILLAFADYAVVFEDLLPPQAVRRSIGLLARSWPIVLFVFLAAQLAWTGLAILYDRYYEAGTRIFVMLPVSQLLLGALLLTLLDVVLISLYALLRRDQA